MPEKVKPPPISPEQAKKYLDDLERLLTTIKGPKTPAGQSPKGGRKTRRSFKKHRLMSRKYCKKTPCRRMGFTQKASCRPYKNCYK